MKFHRKYIAKGVQWLVAIVGITWIVMQLTIRDRVNVVGPTGLVTSAALTQPANADAAEFYTNLSPTPVPRANIVSQPDRKTVPLHRVPTDATSPVVDTPLLGLHLSGDLNRAPVVDALIVKDPAGAGGLRVRPADVVGGFTLRTPRPVVEKGLLSMGRSANPWLLALAIFICPFTLLLAALRWSQILRSQEICLPFARVFVLNMVGNFYNNFMPGSTGGDFMKAYYAGRQTNHKIRAVVSVFVDRVIGLLALMMLGGSMAAYGFFNTTDLHAFAHDLTKLPTFFNETRSEPIFISLSPTARACLGVAAVCLAICGGSVVGALMLSSTRLRHGLGLERLLRRLPMQHHLAKVRDSLRLYKENLALVVWWMLITFPIHITIVVSAIIAGRAFGLGIAWPYYFVCVPVMVLVAALPLAPQGAGVMEYFGFLLLAKQGATVGEVLAITLSIRFVQIFWNLVGGLFTLGGDFGTPTATYDGIADEEEPPEPDPTTLRPTPA